MSMNRTKKQLAKEEREIRELDKLIKAMRRAPRKKKVAR